ncbi:MAG: chemosensory pili system protein ChpA (sensor histidine kinase/response regulator) [Desulforhopalus sp.]|jgi:chemosensory pili system protein ChpA (sensor histidine kinase/response regulator)
MVNFPRAELLELFFQEVKSYIPEMENGLSMVVASRDIQAAGELHRLFHNVKGAAAQVQLSHLSRGARLVEEYLAAIVEDDAPILDGGLDSIQKAIELLGVFVESESSDVAVEERLCRAIEGLNWPREEKDAPGSKGEALGTIRSLLPLLNELASCLGDDLNHREKNRLIYIKLSSAFSTLVELTKTARLEKQSDLFGDFSRLLGSMAEGGNSHQDEISDLVKDFLGFVEVAFSENREDRSTSLQKIHTQLKQVRVLLSHGEMVPAGEILDSDDNFTEVLFGDSENFDDSISFLDELSEVELPVEVVDVPAVESDVFDFFRDDQEDVEADDFFTEDVSQEVSADEKRTENRDAGNETAAEEDAGEVLSYSDTEQEALAEIFKEECEEHFITINASLNNLEQLVALDSSDRTKLVEPLREIRRAVHTLKGAAAITGVSTLAGGAHTLEDMLDWLYDHNEPIGRVEIQLIGESVGTLESLAGTADSSKTEQLQQNIENYLRAKQQTIGDAEENVVNEDVIELLPEVEHGAQKLSLLPEESGTLRVRLEDLDELLSVEGELVVARGAIEKIVEEFSATLIDLENVKDNLRRKSQELESGFEVQALYGGQASSSKSVAPLMLVDDQGGQGGQELAEFDPIELDRYSELNLIIRSLNEISVDVSSIYATFQSLTSDIAGQVSKQQLTMRQMQDKLMRIRMTPLSSISRVLYGTVRSSAAKLGKNVDLNIIGEDVYMDRFVWTKVTDPLVHILRNSVDHGIESPEERRLAGKKDRGKITLRAEQRSRYVVLHISDDGGGLKPHLIREKIAALKIVDNPEGLSDSEILEYIFYPSVSTKKDISELSGRGVGLDVVKKNIQDLRGSIHIDNSPGQGVRFEIHIPYTLSVNRAVLVNVSGSPFAIPLQDIEEIRQFKAEDIRDEDGALSLMIQGEYVPFASLASYVQLEDSLASATGGVALLFSTTSKGGEGANRFVLSVTEIVEQHEIIVKSLGSHLTRVHGVGGVTVSGFGDLIPILNLRELVDVAPQVKQLPIDSENILSSAEPLKVLIVDDSISVRYSVARLVESCGWVQKQAVDGLEALAQLESYMPDVIILDIEMPRMNGYEFKSNINNREAYKDIPVVMLTSRASEKHQLKAKELGVSYYLTKPYEEENFVRILETIEAERN